MNRSYATRLLYNLYWFSFSNRKKLWVTKEKIIYLLRKQEIDYSSSSIAWWRKTSHCNYRALLLNCKGQNKVTITINFPLKRNSTENWTQKRSGTSQHILLVSWNQRQSWQNKTRERHLNLIGYMTDTFENSAPYVNQKFVPKSSIKTSTLQCLIVPNLIC